MRLKKESLPQGRKGKRINEKEQNSLSHKNYASHLDRGKNGLDQFLPVFDLLPERAG